MKKLHHLFLWACLALCTASNAQLDSLGPQGILDNLFSGLDKAKITTGLLSDKTISVYVPLDRYDGIVDTPISFNDIMTLPFVLQNMNMGSLNIPDEEQVKNIYQQHNRNHLIVPLIIDYDYNQISDSAFIKGLIDSSGTVWKDTIIAGVSPYDSKVLKAIAFNYSITGNSFRFLYDPALFLSNKPTPPLLEIDFGDGLGKRKVHPYDSLLINYSTSGPHEISIYAANTGSDDLEKMGKVTMTTKEALNDADYADCRFMFSSEWNAYSWEYQRRITGYDQDGNPVLSNVWMPNYMQAYISIQMGRDQAGGTKHTCLKKPLIFVDGINFGYENHVDEFFSFGNKCNDLGFENIARAIDLNPLTGKVLPDARFIHGPDFIKKATDAGYDIIFFDMLYGATDIKKNAKLLEEFINRMNNGSLQNSSCYCGKSYDEIVIVGPSMGGQVSRYALLDMENNNINNCVREWISFDSPNEGANIALGLQHFVEWTADNNSKAFNLFKPSKDNLSRKLDRDASKQLLIYNHTEKYQSKANPDYYAFFSALDQLGGYPVKCRKAAISNGSLIAVHQDFGGTKPAYNGGALLAELNLPMNRFTNLSYSFYAKIYAEEGSFISAPKCSYNNTRKYVFAATREYKFRAGILPLVTSIKCENINFDGWGFDYAPGGTNDGIMDMDQTLTMTKLVALTPTIVHQRDFSFIPTVSALGIYPNVWQNNGGPLYNVLNNFSASKIVQHLPDYNISPFDAIFGPYTFQQNEPHVFISEGLITWTMEELLMGDYENNLTAGSKAGNYYNFGNLYFNRLKSIMVNPGCSLMVYVNDNRGYKNRAAGYEEQYYANVTAPADNSIFELNTVDNCEPTVVKIMNDAIFELGDGSNRKAITHFRKGSTLELMEGATLHILDGSSLTIDKGAKLIYHKGARIILDGSNAVLQLIGELILPDLDTKFTFTHDPSKPNGFVDFVNSPLINTRGNTNTIEFTGTGLANKIARITDGNLIINGLNVSPAKGIASIKLINGEVEIDFHSAIKTDARISCSSVNFTGKGLLLGNTGLVLYGQPDISISYCRFQNLQTGLDIQNVYNTGALLVLEHNLYNNCLTGANLVMMPVKVNESNFRNCMVGLNADHCSLFKVENTNFSDDVTGLNYTAGNGLSGVIKGCTFGRDADAVKQNGASCSLTIACTDIRYCNNAVYAEGNINMSKLKADKDFAIPGGECNFLNNDYFFTMKKGTLDLVNGNNNFRQGNSLKPTDYIEGEIDANSIFIAGAAPNILNVENNFWIPDPSSNPSLYSFTMLTSMGSYIGIMGITSPAGAPYTNCAGNFYAGGNGGDVQGDLGHDQANGAGNFQLASPAGASSIQDLNDADGINIFPIPVREWLTVELRGLSKSDINDVRLLSAEGNSMAVAYKVEADGIIKINTADYPDGTYFIVVNTGHKVYRKPFIIIH